MIILKIYYFWPIIFHFLVESANRFQQLAFGHLQRKLVRLGDERTQVLHLLVGRAGGQGSEQGAHALPPPVHGGADGGQRPLQLGVVELRVKQLSPKSFHFGVVGAGVCLLAAGLKRRDYPFFRIDFRLFFVFNWFLNFFKDFFVFKKDTLFFH
jgi:hypothetical protein